MACKKCNLPVEEVKPIKYKNADTGENVEYHRACYNAEFRANQPIKDA
jgi:hypothetical protein